jgi:hypothetical protein
MYRWHSTAAEHYNSQNFASFLVKISQGLMECFFKQEERGKHSNIVGGTWYPDGDIHKSPEGMESREGATVANHTRHNHSC